MDFGHVSVKGALFKLKDILNLKMLRPSIIRCLIRLSVSFKPTLVGLLFFVVFAPSSYSSSLVLFLSCPFFKVGVTADGAVAFGSVEPEFDDC